ncbi:hypothetical protein TBLA_0I01210 [Henningerozyma blattae CBS 6284]|uniref:Chromatin structure-remodeling complex subunit RSC7 n=1 Tax=Henningerozyma blattae (strain ATCC 34711 / CBS 6284 / DSM 70876 / NBRC 10599 / NRRL Y-10934 / UCD 77-7) TaxID=1071380 RepID=I2H8S9_HENB6|nr:hypothetical protein TBLA_0I01210 [Tetrapisispora blattae CBS 6284]CCH62781.1 hypothetical protein TBLA_0I01210 [Tetrapisispora blattae CBS 6284]
MSPSKQETDTVDTLNSARSRTRSPSRIDYSIDTEGMVLPKDNEDDEEYREEEDDQLLSKKRKQDEDGDDNDAEYDADDVSTTRRKKRNTDGKVRSNSVSDNDRSRSASVSVPAVEKRGKSVVPIDKNGEPYILENEEYVLPIDEEGEEKITKDGDLLGGRKFMVRTFTVLGHGSTKFMLGTEPARAVGFRDSYLFFQTHPNLYKFVITQEEKNDLINRGALPYSYRGRQIALVTARSVFREFGAKIIINGKNITDDYYAKRLRQEGNVVEGTFAREPPKKPSHPHMKYSQADVLNAASNPARNTVEFFDRRHHHGGSTLTSANMTQATGKTLNSTNWLYQNAAASSRFNSDMYYDRVRILLIEQQGMRDPYTNTVHLPQSTQPTRVIDWSKIEDTKLEKDERFSIINEIRIQDSDLTRSFTGLSDIPKEVYEGLVSDDIKKAIEEQIDFENGKI